MNMTSGKVDVEINSFQRDTAEAAAAAAISASADDSLVRAMQAILNKIETAELANTNWTSDETMDVAKWLDMKPSDAVFADIQSQCDDDEDFTRDDTEHVNQPVGCNRVARKTEYIANTSDSLSDEGFSSSSSTSTTPTWQAPGCEFDLNRSGQRDTEVLQWIDTSKLGSDEDDQNLVNRMRSAIEARAQSCQGSATLTTDNRYKTELCRSFQEYGICKYTKKCQFAHGTEEMRNVRRHPKYKTKMCRVYHTSGFCPYGSRCHFVHELDECPDRSIVATLADNQTTRLAAFSQLVG